MGGRLPDHCIPGRTPENRITRFLEELFQMLVLSRQRDESIMIGEDVVVTIVDVRGDRVRLGIDAPSEIPVHRREVYEAIHRENQRAAAAKPEDLDTIR